MFAAALALHGIDVDQMLGQMNNNKQLQSGLSIEDLKRTNQLRNWIKFDTTHTEYLLYLWIHDCRTAFDHKIPITPNALKIIAAQLNESSNDVDSYAAYLKIAVTLVNSEIADVHEQSRCSLLLNNYVAGVAPLNLGQLLHMLNSAKFKLRVHCSMSDKMTNLAVVLQEFPQLLRLSDAIRDVDKQCNLVLFDPATHPDLKNVYQRGMDMCREYRQLHPRSCLSFT